jgi:hypothetical protein
MFDVACHFQAVHSDGLLPVQIIYRLNFPVLNEIVIIMQCIDKTAQHNIFYLIHTRKFY